MNVQWMVPELPITQITNGQFDIYFSATAGWSWEEGTQTGLAMGEGHSLHIIIKRVHEDDTFFEAEAKRQHEAFLDSGRDYKTVGRNLWNWVKENA